VILTLKTLICWNLLEKREPFRVAFLYEKALKKIFMRYASRLQHYLALKNEIFSSTVRAFYKNGLNLKYGTVLAFEFFSGKTENFRQKKRYASRLETASVIKIVTENGRVRYGTVLWINTDSLLYFGSF
jgi:hypothetical protein